MISWKETKRKANRIKFASMGKRVQIYCPVCKAGFRTDETYKTHYKKEHTK